MSVSSDIAWYEPAATPNACERACVRPADVIPLLGRVLDQEAATATADFFSILADPTRLQILHALAQSDELCVCDLAVLVGASQSAVSHQLRMLRTAGVVARRRQGRVMAYRLTDSHVTSILLTALEHMEEPR